MIMTFKQVLAKAAENNITAWRLMVADEVDCYLDGRDFSVDDDTFEAICEFVYDWCINTEATPYEVVSNLVETIKDHEQFEFTAESINANWQELTEIINLMF
jgi:hypothetical protein